VRSEHAALNTALQSGGAIVAKKWISNIYADAANAGLSHDRGQDWWMAIWSHDEVQNNVRQRFVEQMCDILLDAAKRVEQDLKLNCPIAAEAKVGSNWFDTH
jgi:DNA polymerase I-like protein with 3'-5' exonuclease and polymerase domains